MVKEFTFKNKKYIFDEEYWDKEYKKENLLINTLEFQLNQFEYLFEMRDYSTIKNRINNMLKWGGLKEIK
jgi:hypothetical protein